MTFVIPLLTHFSVKLFSPFTNNTILGGKRLHIIFISASFRIFRFTKYKYSIIW